MTAKKKPSELKPRGRPTKLLSDKIRNDLLNYIRAGNYREAAAQAVGVSSGSLSKWMRIDKEPYLSFRKAVLEAENLAEIRAVAGIIKAGAADPKHYQWWLERKFPERWGRKDKVILQVETELRVMAEKLKANLDPDIFAKVAEILSQ